MIDYFQKEAQECKRLAAQATGKKDREYWLHMAERWEWLVQQNGDTKLGNAQPRLIFKAPRRVAHREAAGVTASTVMRASSNVRFRG